MVPAPNDGAETSLETFLEPLCPPAGVVSFRSNEAVHERMFFTFRDNGFANDQELVEATVEKLDEHEPSVGPNAEKQSWFGATDRLGAVLLEMGFTTLDVDGVLSTLKVNKVATREVSATADSLNETGFRSILGAERRGS